MSRTGAAPEEAFGRLRAMSQSRHVKVAEVARVLLDEAGWPGPGEETRARARRFGILTSRRLAGTEWASLEGRIGSHPQFA